MLQFGLGFQPYQARVRAGRLSTPWLEKQRRELAASAFAQAPTSELQAPEKFQSSNTNMRAQNWSFSGCWKLEFKAFSTRNVAPLSGADDAGVRSVLDTRAKGVLQLFEQKAPRF
jgi:hypothetical protein